MTTDTPKRRWYQFSLRKLLIVMLVFVLGVGWIGYRMNRARDNRARVAAAEDRILKAVAAIEKLGGEVESAYEELRPQTWLEKQLDDPGGPDDPVVVLEVTEVHLGYADFWEYVAARLRSEHLDVDGDDLEYLRGLSDLERLSLDGINVTDTGMEQLKGLKNLRHLDLVFTGITDTGLEHIRGLTNLRQLDLEFTMIEGVQHLKGLTNLQELILANTQVTDAGLEQLKGLTKLQYLSLDNTDVTDAGLEHLKGMTSLESLNLRYTQVTDAGLEHLRGLTNLKYLNLVPTNVTNDGVKKLRKALPNCEIYGPYEIYGP